MNWQAECYSCRYMQKIKKSCYIRCTNADPDMDGAPRAKEKGWFNYPLSFDPVWKSIKCKNYVKKEYT